MEPISTEIASKIDFNFESGFFKKQCFPYENPFRVGFRGSKFGANINLQFIKTWIQKRDASWYRRLIDYVCFLEPSLGQIGRGSRSKIDPKRHWTHDAKKKASWRCVGPSWRRLIAALGMCMHVQETYMRIHAKHKVKLQTRHRGNSRMKTSYP